MGRLLLLRHGESEWNAAGRWQGWADIALTPLGEAQASHAATRLAGLPGARFTAVVASDLRRAQRTAEILAYGLGIDIDSVETEPELREFDVGDWSGLTKAEIEQRWPGQLTAWWNNELDRTPGGEPREQFVQRVVAATERLVDRPGQVLGVSHGGVVGALQRTLGVDGDQPRITNLAGRWFAREDGNLTPGDLVTLLDPDEMTVSPSR
ncbi:MAG: glucosyl-3-phosphoglycerate phosphatase [Acidimicrobiaceae bacterium]|nr:glucosyl-3-phosphoglycerate phosphatase [Acidimicrobiaceae bacterium]